jgi:hypothetical protein
MPGKRIALTIVVCLAALALHVAVPADVFAQAWVPPKGEGSLTTTYQKVDVRDHFDADGDIEDRGRIHTHNLITTLEYGLTDKLALDFEVAYVASKFEGRGRRPHGPVDDGFFHPTFSDAHVGLRYNVATRPLVVTPFFSFTLPTHDYEVRGHSAVGRGFHELVLGVNVGRQLGPILPKAYAHLRFSYAILKHFAGLNLNHTNAEWEVGWLANRLIVLRFIGAWQASQGGLEFPAGVMLTPAQFAIHDRVARADYVQLGGVVTFPMNRTFDIHTGYAKTVSARNTHGDAGIILGFTWRFSTRSSFGRIAENTSPNRPTTMEQGLF